MKPGTRYVRTGPARIWTETFTTENAVGCVLFVNGSGEYRTVSMRETRDLGRWITSLGFHLVVSDKYGCGESGGRWARVTMDILVECLIDLVTNLSSAHGLPTIVLGHSEGSRVAVEAARAAPGISALVLRVPSSQPIRERIAMQCSTFPSLGASAWAEWSTAIAKLERGGSARGFLLDHPKTYWRSLLERPTCADLVRELRVPVLALHGALDEHTPESAYASIHEALARHRHAYSAARVVGGVGHRLRLEDQRWGESEADACIARWLAGLPALDRR